MVGNFRHRLVRSICYLRYLKRQTLYRNSRKNVCYHQSCDSQQSSSAKNAEKFPSRVLIFLSCSKIGILLSALLPTKKCRMAAPTESLLPALTPGGTSGSFCYANRTRWTEIKLKSFFGSNYKQKWIGFLPKKLVRFLQTKLLGFMFEHFFWTTPVKMVRFVQRPKKAWKNVHLSMVRPTAIPWSVCELDSEELFRSGPWQITHLSAFVN